MVKPSKRRTDYKPPFPWFGGKSPVADTVWAALGDVPNYVEPFFGSGAVLFLRPAMDGNWIETVNDADGFVSNFWRSMQKDVEAVAYHADWPVNEADLHARHLWLLGQRERITERLMGDPEFYDAKAAGWWCWGLCCWIGGGWCLGNGSWKAINGLMVKTESGGGVRRTKPDIGASNWGTSKRGVVRERDHLVEYLSGFTDRLSDVRVCCGDWFRVISSPAATFKHGLTGVFLDPPYSGVANRDNALYGVENQQVAHDVRKWAIEQDQNRDMRIVLCGYEGEHEMPADWRTIEWQAAGGYGGPQSRSWLNRKRERLWLSPHCLDVYAETEPLWSRELVPA